MKSLLWGVGLVVIGFFGYWIIQTIKAMKDPDVQIATDLRMSVKRYRKYQRLYDTYQAALLKYGFGSKEEENFYKKEILPNIGNPNEWRRYQAYRGNADQKKRSSLIQNNDNQWKPTPIHEAFRNVRKSE